MKNKPVLLVFIDWFSPGYKAGGPISSCLNFVYLMSDAYSVYVFTADRDQGDTAPYKNIVQDKWITFAGTDCMVYYAQKDKLSFQQIKQVAKDLNPDFIYLNNMFSPYYVLYPVWMKWRGELKAKMIITPRGTLYDSALAVKPLKKKIFISIFRWLGIYKKLIFQATSIREQQAIEHFFPGSKVQLADDLPNMRQPAFQTTAKQEGMVKCIFIARIVNIKNLMFLLNVLQNVKTNAALTIAGPIEEPEYWKLCQEKIQQLPGNVKVNYVGPKPAAELLALTWQHHLYILPTMGENFGHTIFEALQAGRPVLISDQTPWLGLKENGVGWDLALNNCSAFKEAIEEAAGWDQQAFNKISAKAWQYAKNYLDTAGFKTKYISLFS